MSKLHTTDELEEMKEDLRKHYLKRSFRRGFYLGLHAGMFIAWLTYVLLIK